MAITLKSQNPQELERNGDASTVIWKAISHAVIFKIAMLLPLIAFVMGCLVFIGIGLIVLSPGIPALHLTSVNLFLFVVGAFLGTFALELLYGRIFADAGNHLRNTVAVFGQIPVMLIGAVVGGAGAVWFKTRIPKVQPN